MDGSIYLSVAGVQGRYFLRDGYHRAYGLLAAGITHVPGFVRDYPTYADTKMPTTMLPPEETLGARPALLGDYLDDTVSVETHAPITTKIIVIQALEVGALG